MASGDLTLHLPAWKWGKSDAGVVEDRSTTTQLRTPTCGWRIACLRRDACGTTHAMKADVGQLLAARIAKEEVVLVPGLGNHCWRPDRTDFHLPHDDTYILNPSYLPLPVLVRLGEAVFPQAAVE